MPNFLDTVQVSGSSYEIKDKNAASVSSVTQSEYDDLPSSAKSSNTLFVITDATAVDISNYWTSAQTNSAITAAVSGKADTSAVTEAISGKADTSAVTEAISGKVDTSAVTSSVTSASTDNEIPTAKAVFDAIPTGTSITIDPTLDSGSTNAVANSAITTALNDTVKLSNQSTYYLNGFYSDEAKHYPIYHRFNTNNQSNGNGWWYGKINNQYVIKNGQYNQKPSGLMDLQVVETSAITTSVTSASTDSQVPSAKAVYDAIGEGGSVSSAITSGDTNAVAGGAVYAKLDEIEQVTARALNQLAEANEVVARALNDLNDRITAIENRLNNS